MLSPLIDLFLSEMQLPLLLRNPYQVQMHVFGSQIPIEDEHVVIVGEIVPRSLEEFVLVFLQEFGEALRRHLVHSVPEISQPYVILSGGLSPVLNSCWC